MDCINQELNNKLDTLMQTTTTTTHNPKKQRGNSNKNTRAINLTHAQFSREQINTLALSLSYAVTKTLGIILTH
jgi:hypothetical protein